jgi:23S rRNA (cytidine1920-2'-O)/16S rRNA (cytidine1409-2'-O)-methyltransferase
VRDPEAHQLAIDRVADCVRGLAWEVVETIPSPITGMEGNKEFLLYARRGRGAGVVNRDGGVSRA